MTFSWDRSDCMSPPYHHKLLEKHWSLPAVGLHVNIDSVSQQKQRLSKTRFGILESKHSLWQCQMHGGCFLLACIPRIEAGIPLFNFLSVNFSPWGSPMLPIGCLLCITLGEHFHTVHVQWGRVWGSFLQGLWFLVLQCIITKGYPRTLLFGQNHPKLAKLWQAHFSECSDLLQGQFPLFKGSFCSSSCQLEGEGFEHIPK